MDFNEKIKDKGLKKKKIAEIAGITPSHLSRVLCGKMSLTAKIEEKLIQILK